MRSKPENLTYPSNSSYSQCFCSPVLLFHKLSRFTPPSMPPRLATLSRNASTGSSSSTRGISSTKVFGPKCSRIVNSIIRSLFASRFDPRREITPGSSANRSATCKAAEDDCLERRNSIRPRVPSRVAYKAEQGGNELFWSPWTMYPRS